MPKSIVWNCFDKTVNGATCKLCKSVVRTCGNTTNLHNHMKRKHSFVKYDSPSTSKIRRSSEHSIASTSKTHNDVDDPDVVSDAADFSNFVLDIVNKAEQLQRKINVIPQSSGSVNNDSAKSRSRSVSSMQTVSLSDITSYDLLEGGCKTQAITDALVYMLAKDNMPLSITEKTGFIYFMRKAVPMYKVPSSENLTTLIKSKYDALLASIKTKLSLVEHVTLTADIWTDVINTNRFLGMTGHFLSSSKLALESVTLGVLELSDSYTANNISTWIESLLNEWHIKKEQVVTVITNNGANILSAAKKTFGWEKHLPCFAHTLNLMLQRALENLKFIQLVINKIKTIVTFFKHSVSASNELQKLCSLKLKLSVPTQWNSIFYMIDRFISCSTHIAAVLINIRGAPHMLTSYEIETAKEMLLVLRPIEVAIKEFCGQSYITASTIIPLINCLIKKTVCVDVSIPIVLQLKSTILRNLIEKFGKVEDIHMLTVATILDPRFKSIHLNNSLSISKAIRIIKTKIKEIKNNCDDSNNSNRGSSDDDSEQADRLWSVHNELVKHNSEQNDEEMPTDLKNYLSQPTIPLSDDTLKYWDVLGNMYPYLKKIVQPYLSFVVTSVPSERLFSKAGNIMYEKRNRLNLKGEKLQQLLFLGSLNFEDWHIE